MQNHCDSMENPRKTVVYAGFWVRLGAYLIDSIAVAAALLIVRLVLFVFTLLAAPADGFFHTEILFHYTLKDILLYGLRALYFILCTYCTGTTLGKRAMNLRVICADGSRKLSLLDVVYRETVGRFLSGILLGVGYFIIGISGEKCGFHDMLCDTRVIYAKPVKLYPAYAAQGSSMIPAMQPEPSNHGTGTFSARREDPVEEERLPEEVFRAAPEGSASETPGEKDEDLQ